MDFDTSTGILWASVPSGSNNLSNFLTQIDTTTGNVTVIGQTVTGLDALAVRSVRSVPEPSSFVLAALGIVGLVGYRKRRRSR
jgi:PEP-CTERM motif